MRDAVDTHWLPAETCLTALERETRRFREVLADAPSGAEVPSCPDWDVDDLLWHLGGEVQHFWAWTIAHRPEVPRDWAEQERPAGRDELLALLDHAHEDLVRRLRGAHPTDPAWSWADDPRLHTVGFTMRRQAHEALIHRVDAELAVGSARPSTRNWPPTASSSASSGCTASTPRGGASTTTAGGSSSGRPTRGAGS